MSNYTIFNAVYAPICIGVAFLLCRNWVDRKVSAKVALWLTMFFYPWDFFAIQYRAWDYENPGPRLFTVPYNDLVFIFASTLLSAAFFCRKRF